jgi:hypothetical protein
MRAWLLFFLLVATAGRTEAEQPVTFTAMDVWLDSGQVPLAAYQIQIRYDPVVARVVGIEGGATPAFNAAPFYDPAGMEGGRIVIAAFTTDDASAPTGRTRVARIHWRVAGGAMPEISARLVTAARVGGQRFVPAVEVAPMEKPKGD